LYLFDLKKEDVERLDRDNILVVNTLKGDTDSFSELVQNHQSRLYSFLLKMTYSKEDAEEIMQEVFIRAYNYLYKYDSRWSFSSWLYRIAVNTFKTEYKKKKTRNNIDYYDQLPEELCSIDNCPESVYEMKEHYREILAMIYELKKEQKLAFLLKNVQDFSYKEVGDILGISAEAAKMRVQRAKETLWYRFEKLQKRSVGL
jgi:RNA polymerase sigma-70 factor (ECF subfamily)